MYDYPMMFTDVQVERLWQLVNINIVATTMMTQIILPGMVERGRGAIINMASSASLKPTPQMSVYAATKAYIDYFSRAINYEYKSKGIIVQSLMPFYVATRMTRFSDALSKPSLLVPSATKYVQHALCTLSYSTRTTGYWPHTLQWWFLSLIPENIYMWGAMRVLNALRRQTHNRIRHRSGQKGSQGSTGSMSESDSTTIEPSSSIGSISTIGPSASSSSVFYSATEDSQSNLASMDKPHVKFD
ncbi:unnamed protein product [Owenia fusiformis]|nr:unnamed protein product [Owenia fusiformis]